MSSRRAVVTVILGLLLLPATASAAPDWVAPFNFSVPLTDVSIGGIQGQDQILYQNGGIATEAFLQVESISPIHTTLHVGTLAPGGSYSDQLTIPSSEGAIPVGVQIAVASSGAAVATWAELIGNELEKSPYHFRAAYRPAGSSAWEAPFTIATETEREKNFTATLTPVISANGTAAVGIQRFANGESTGFYKRPNYRVDVAAHPAGGSWQAPERLSPVATSATSLALAFDGSGDLTAAYTKRFFEAAKGEEENDRSTVIVRRRPASSGVWGFEEDITGSEIQWSADAMYLGENEAGDAVVAYQYFRKVPQTLETKAVTRQGPNGSWTAPAHLSGTSGTAGVGVSPDGKAYVLYWFQGISSAESCEGVVRAPVGGSFSAERCLSPPNEDTFSGSVAFLGNDAYFAWRGNVPGEQSNTTVQGGRWADGSTLPDVAHNLDTPGLLYGYPSLVNDDQGSVVALYTNPGGLLRAAAYDGGPPILLGANVPASATAGQPVSFSASFFDLWAGLGGGQPTWSFGDGSAPVGGGTATHTFTAPGTYTISLGAADALGNAAGITTYTITVKPAAVTGPPADTQAPAVKLNLPKCAKKLSKKACKRQRASRSAWQTLTGTVTDPAPSSGIAGVEVAIYRTTGKRIEGLVGKHFRKTTKTKARKTFTAATVSGASWSLHLPKLKSGRYTILVRATDKAGHVSATVTKTLQLK
jgi:PKD repeat protein